MGQEWFGPLPPFISPYNMGAMGGSSGGGNPGTNFFGDAAYGTDGGGGMGADAAGQSGFGYVPARHGSLSQSQQLELMNVLETEGVGDINAFLNAGSDMVVDGTWY